MDLSLLGAEGGWQDFDLKGGEWTVLLLSAAAALLAIGVGFYLARSVLAADQGTPKMQEIALAIQEGALAYLKRQFRTIGFILIPVAADRVLHVDRDRQARRQRGADVRRSPALCRTVAFILGCVASGLTGYIGMTLATRGNVRTAAAAQDRLACPRRSPSPSAPAASPACSRSASACSAPP